MINTISDNIFSSSVQEITQEYSHISLTNAQACCIIIGFTVICVVFLQVVKSILNKSCIGCNRIKQCEKRLEKLEKGVNIDKRA